MCIRDSGQGEDLREHYDREEIHGRGLRSKGGRLESPRFVLPGRDDVVHALQVGVAHAPALPVRHAADESG